MGIDMSEPKYAKQLTHGEAIVFAFAYTTLAETAKVHLTCNEMSTLAATCSQVVKKLHAILTGEIEDESSEDLPGLSFLRHCGTPLADRYFKEMGLAIVDTLGVQTHARLRDALAAQLIDL